MPFLTALACLLVRRAPRLRRAVSLMGALTGLGVALFLLFQVWTLGILVTRPGGWPAPYGITLVADPLAAAMVVVTAFVGAGTVAYLVGAPDPVQEGHGQHALVHTLLGGVTGAFLAGDLFNLYVWFEVLLIASFVLLSLGGTRASLEGGLKYVVLNLLSSTLFLAGIGLLYGATGTLNLGHLAQVTSGLEASLVTPLSFLFLTGFAIKAALFPVHFWLPTSYHTPPVAISALFSGLLTKVGVYALIRLFTLVFVQDVPHTHGVVLLVMAGLTMLGGVLGALAQNGFRRILSFHIISQIGYMILGLALFTPLALAGAIFYVLHHIIVKTNLFFVSGIAERLQETKSLDGMGGLAKARPLVAVLFLLPALSLAGVPPLSGFWAKLLIVVSSLETGASLFAALALIVGLLTLLSMTKIWLHVFWRPRSRTMHSAEQKVSLPHVPMLWTMTVVAFAAVTVAIGLFPALLFALSERAAAGLLDPSAYIEAVTGGGDTP